MNIIDKTLEEAGLLEFYNLHSSAKCFIAGGACTRLYFGAKDLGLSDLDIYVNVEHKEFIDDVLLSGGNFALITETNRARTYLNSFSGTKIQLVETYYGDVTNDEYMAQRACLDSFDISACQLVYKFGQLTDCGLGAKELLDKGLMRIYNSMRLDRIFKYLQRYPLKLDLTHASTVLATEIMREGLFTQFNKTKGVVDYHSYAE